MWNVLVRGWMIGFLVLLLAACGGPAAPDNGPGEKGGAQDVSDPVEIGGSPAQASTSGEFSHRMVAFASSVMLITSEEELETLEGVVEGMEGMMPGGIPGPLNPGNPGSPFVPFDVAGAILRTEGPSNIYVMDSNGRGLRRLTDGGASWPVWSPDGDRIAFGADGDIWVMDRDGGNKTRLTEQGGWYPTWSPAGQKIAFISPRADTTNDTPDIYVMNANGSNVQRVTETVLWGPDYQPSAFRQEFGATGANHPAWSPDGTKIAFTSVRDYDDTEIYVINADGTGIELVTDHRNDELAGTAYGSYHDYEPAWSPDGTRIAFSSDRDGEREIYVVNADGTGRTRLTDNTYPALQPSWSPDGSKIAFISSAGLHSDIILMDPDGGNQTRLVTTRVGKETWPSFGPEAEVASPGGDQRQRAQEYISAVDRLVSVLIEHMNREIRLGNLDCGTLVTCAPAERIEAAQGIKDAYEAIRNLDAPECVKSLHTQNLELLEQYYIGAEYIISHIRANVPLGRASDAIVDHELMGRFERELNAFDPSVCRGESEDVNGPTMFVESLASPDFKQATGGRAVLLPRGEDEQATEQEASIDPINVSTGTIGFADLNGTVIQYGEVPERFVPELPDVNTLHNGRLHIVMEKSLPGALVGIKIYGWRAISTGVSYDPDRATATVLICEYISEYEGPVEPGSPSTYPPIYRFWLGDKPRDASHEPSIRGTASHCPETASEAAP